jgi:hypothetical protein
LRGDDRRFAGERDRLGTRLGVDDGGEGAGELDPSRLAVLDPVRLHERAYVPAQRSTIRYWPVASVTAVRTFSISTALDASTLTPGSTAPECP